MKKTLALVGCGREKRDDPSEARSLYTSTYFQKKRQWAEGCHSWRVLSAEHGLVLPTTVLEPYDTAMGDLDEAAAQGWGEEVMDTLRSQLDEFDEVVVLAGRDYFDPISDELHAASVTVRWPFEGKRLFEQIQWLQEHSPPDQSTLGSFE